jgi:hypothetical protein
MERSTPNALFLALNTMLDVNQRSFEVLREAATILELAKEIKRPATKSYWNKYLSKLSDSGIRKKRSPRTIRPFSSVRLTHDFDIYEMTGIFPTEFETIYQQLDLSNARNGGMKRETIMTDRMRLLIVLHWIRQYCDYQTMSLIFKVSRCMYQFFK